VSATVSVRSAARARFAQRLVDLRLFPNYNSSTAQIASGLEAVLRKLPGLRGLVLEDRKTGKWTDAHLAQCATLPLERFGLETCSTITAGALVQALRTWHRTLSGLHFWACKALTDDVLAWCGSERIHTLQLQNARVSDEAFAALLRRCANLQHLLTPGAVGPRAFTVLASGAALPLLVTLALTEPLPGSDRAGLITQFKQWRRAHLRVLWLVNVNYTVPLDSVISRLAGVRVLSLGGTALHPDELLLLAQVTGGHLWHLLLDRWQHFSTLDPLLRVLPHLTALRSLCLHRLFGDLVHAWSFLDGLMQGGVPPPCDPPAWTERQGIGEGRPLSALADCKGGLQSMAFEVQAVLHPDRWPRHLKRFYMLLDERDAERERRHESRARGLAQCFANSGWRTHVLCAEDGRESDGAFEDSFVDWHRDAYRDDDATVEGASVSSNWRPWQAGGQLRHLHDDVRMCFIDTIGRWQPFFLT
jgi:hypothetical protein